MSEKLTANIAGEPSEWHRMQHAQAMATEAFLKRLRAVCQLADQASGLVGRDAYLDRDMECEFHYLFQRQTEIAQRPWQRMLSDTLMALPINPISVVKP